MYWSSNLFIYYFIATCAMTINSYNNSAIQHLCFGSQIWDLWNSRKSQNFWKSKKKKKYSKRIYETGRLSLKPKPPFLKDLIFWPWLILSLLIYCQLCCLCDSARLGFFCVCVFASDHGIVFRTGRRAQHWWVGDPAAGDWNFRETAPGEGHKGPPGKLRWRHHIY